MRWSGQGGGDAASEALDEIADLRGTTFTMVFGETLDDRWYSPRGLDQGHGKHGGHDERPH